MESIFSLPTRPEAIEISYERNTILKLLVEWLSADNPNAIPFFGLSGFVQILIFENPYTLEICFVTTLLRRHKRGRIQKNLVNN